MICNVCGKTIDRWIFDNVINRTLASSWNLSKPEIRFFDLRESQYCPFCHNSSRTRELAQAIMETIPFGKIGVFNQWVIKAKEKGLQVAEINSCGRLHSSLKKIPTVYSEYYEGSRLSFLFKSFKYVRKENITRLSYKDNTFDLVLHSEVLEHVSDPHKALLECRRVLKPNGICLFTIPVIKNRKTFKCAEIKNGQVIHLKVPSYHGSSVKSDWLVNWEFGGDFIKKEKLEALGGVFKISK